MSDGTTGRILVIDDEANIRTMLRVCLEGADVAEALARFARERSITHAVFGRARGPSWRDRLRGSLVERFMRLAPDVDVLVVAARDEPEAP